MPKPMIRIARLPSGYWVGVAAIPLPITAVAGALPVGHGHIYENIATYEIIDERPIYSAVVKSMLRQMRKNGVAVGGFFGKLWGKIKRVARKVAKRVARIRIVRNIIKSAKKVARFAKNVAKKVMPIIKAIGPAILDAASAIPIIGPSVRPLARSIGSVVKLIGKGIKLVRKAFRGGKAALRGIKRIAKKAALGFPKAKQALMLLKKIKHNTRAITRQHRRARRVQRHIRRKIRPALRLIRSRRDGRALRERARRMLARLRQPPYGLPPVRRPLRRPVRRRVPARVPPGRVIMLPPMPRGGRVVIGQPPVPGAVRIPRLPPEPVAPEAQGLDAEWQDYMVRVDRWESAKRGHKKLLRRNKLLRRRTLLYGTISSMTPKQVFAAL